MSQLVVDEESSSDEASMLQEQKPRVLTLKKKSDRKEHFLQEKGKANFSELIYTENIFDHTVPNIFLSKAYVANQLQFCTKITKTSSNIYSDLGSNW